MLDVGNSGRSIILHVPNLLMQSHTVSYASSSRSEFQILQAQHQRLNSSQAHAKKTSATDCWIFTEAYCICMVIQHTVHVANMLTSHTVSLALPAQIEVMSLPRCFDCLRTFGKAKIQTLWWINNTGFTLGSVWKQWLQRVIWVTWHSVPLGSCTEGFGVMKLFLFGFNIKNNNKSISLALFTRASLQTTLFEKSKWKYE